MHQGLKNYPPYASFLKCLKEKGQIQIPGRHDKEGKRKLGINLKEEYKITFVAFDTFLSWAESVGHVYRSAFEQILYWGGEWDITRPSLQYFRSVCGKSYDQIDKTSGYANLGYLAHPVCKELRISFPAFEMKMNQFIETFPGEITLAPATIRSNIAKNHEIISIRPRKEILRERLSEKLLEDNYLRKEQDSKGRKSQWLEYRFLEDGIRVNGKLVKLIRWE